jgi:hypothetical protein
MVCKELESDILTNSSKSLSQLDQVVASLAERFDSMYALPGTLDDQLEEVSRFVQELAINNPVMQAPPVPRRNPARSPTSETPDPLDTIAAPLSPPALSPRRTYTSTTTRQRATSAEPLTSRPATVDSSPTWTVQTSAEPPTPPRKRVSEFSFGGSSVRNSASSYASSNSSVPSRDSMNGRNARISVAKSLPLPRTPELHEPTQPKGGSLPLLPPPAIRPSSNYSADTIERVRSSSTLSPFPARQDSITKLHRSSTTTSQKATFEKEAFRNSAVLCDV